MSELTPSTDPMNQPEQNTVYRPNPIFFGRFGLRAGWSLTIFLPLWVLFCFFGAGVVGLTASGQLKTVIQEHMTGAPLTVKDLPSLTYGQDAMMFFSLLAVCWFFARAERRKLSVYGLGKNHIADILPGAINGFLVMSLFILVLHAMHVLVFDGRAEYGLSAFVYGAIWLIGFVLVGLAEEYVFRGYIQYTLTRGLSGLGEIISPQHARAIAFWIAAIIWSAGFGLAHHENSGETLAGLFSIVLSGLVFCYALWRTGSLWYGVGLHMAWDWAQSFLYGVPDSGTNAVGRLFNTHPQGSILLSGGTVGPEGSVLVIPALLLIILIIRFTTRPRSQPSLEQEPFSLPPVSNSFLA